MRWTLAGLLSIAACYAPAIAPGVPCADNGRCPDGQACDERQVCMVASTIEPGDAPDPGDPRDAGVDGETSDGMKAGDTDGDGVADTTDNCAADSNPDQADEDGDMIGDRCDLCPQLAGEIADADGDHIGDACDPNAGATDVSWLFEGFRGGLPSWSGSTGWQSVSDGVQVAAAGEPAPDSEYLLLPLAHEGRTSFDRYSTTVSIAIQQTGSGAFHEAGIEYFDDNAQNGALCEIAEVNGSRVLWLGDGAERIDVKKPYAWTNGATYVLRLVRHGNAYSCDVNGPQGPLSATANFTLVPRTGADTDIWVYGATARIGSVSVVGPPP